MEFYSVTTGIIGQGGRRGALMLTMSDSHPDVLDPRASRDATDQDERYRYHYYLSPTCVSEAELEEPSLAELARVIKAGACIEIYQSCNLHKTLC